MAQRYPAYPVITPAPADADAKQGGGRRVLPSPYGGGARQLGIPNLVATYDGVTTVSLLEAFWDSFIGLQAIVANNDRYDTFANGAGTVPVLGADATTGRSRVRIAPNIAAVNEGSGFRFRGTFTPRSAEDWGFKCIVSEEQAPAGGTVSFEIGLLSATANNSPDGIYFRSTNSGNLFLVCRSTSETTLDLGVGFDSTLRLLEFRVVNDGAKVEAYLANRLVGAVAATIPTGLLIPAARVHNEAVTVTTPQIALVWGWGMKSGF